MVFRERGLGNDRQVRHLADAQDGGPGLFRIKHGLHDEAVSASVSQAPGLLGIKRHRFRKGQFAQGCQQGTRRSHGTGHLHAGSYRRPGQGGSGAVDLVDPLLQTVVHEAGAGPAKGVGFHQRCPGLRVGLVNGSDHFGPLVTCPDERPQFANQVERAGHQNEIVRTGCGDRRL